MEILSLEDYRLRARRWLDANMEPKAPGAGPPARKVIYRRDDPAIAAQRRLQHKLYEGGFAGITWPKDVGGQGLSAAHQRIFDEQARHYVMPDFGIAGGTTMVVCGPTLLAHASPDFKRLHVPKILSGDELWVQFFSEPGAGSDLAAVRTRADRDGDRWILNGHKMWTSGALSADYGLCLARTNWDVPKHRGLTWFAVPVSVAGLTIRPIRQINGSSEFCEEFLDDVELGEDAVIGDVDEGWTVTRTMLAIERAAGNPAALVRRQGPRQLAPDLVALARRTGRHTDPGVRQLIARAHINDFVQQELDERVATLQAGGADADIAAYSKLAVGTYDPVRARIALEIGGSAAVAWPHGDVDAVKTALGYLDGRIYSIAGGTNEMQRNAISERVLGLPREPAYDLDKPFREAVRDAERWPPTR
jgi:alkylation response protein AidB-like acyl-CoA dehydrogenase